MKLEHLIDKLEQVYEDDPDVIVDYISIKDGNLCIQINHSYTCNQGEEQQLGYLITKYLDKYEYEDGIPLIRRGTNGI